MFPRQVIHPEFRLNGQSLSEIDISDFDFLAEWLSEQEHLAVTTSGSTGTPKTIFLDKQKMIASARATISYFDLPEKSTALLCLSSDYIAGKMMWVRALVAGWHLDVGEVSSYPLSRKRKNYDFAAMVPLQVENSLENLDLIQKLIIGGAAVSPILERKLQNTSCQCFSTYGMTETITHIAVKKLNHLKSEKSAFEALPGVRFETDARNCLIIDAPAISEEKVGTNDVVELLSETRFHWLGRADFVINSGGIKIHPEAVERKLFSQIPNPFFIASLPDDLLGEKVVLLVENPTKIPIDFSVLDKYEIPKQVFFLPKFFYTPNGKLQRQETLSQLPES